jgi:hypothetical protein
MHAVKRTGRDRIIPDIMTTPTLDSCIADIFDPGNTPGVSGSIGAPVYGGYELQGDFSSKVIILSDTLPFSLHQYYGTTPPYAVGFVLLANASLGTIHSSLAYHGRSGTIAAGMTVTGLTSGAAAIIVSDAPSGTSGSLVLSNQNGAFVNGETIQIAPRTLAVADV